MHLPDTSICFPNENGVLEKLVLPILQTLNLEK